MGERTSPTDAIERIAWNLNYYPGETVTLNKLADLTGLSWATVQKYTQLMEALGRILPRIDVTQDGVEVKHQSSNVASLHKQEDLAVLVYLIIQAEIKGDPTESLEIDEHADVLEQYPSTLQNLAEIGWIKRTEGKVKLTPKGVAIAGRTRAEVRNLDRGHGADRIRRYPKDGKTITVVEREPRMLEKEPRGSVDQRPERGTKRDYSRTDDFEAPTYSSEPTTYAD